MFTCFLFLNHLLHNYELATRGFQQEFQTGNISMSSSILLQIALFGLIVWAGGQLLRGHERAIIRIRGVGILFLIYGVLISMAQVYSEQNVVGSYSGYIYIMVCLPLLLHISAYLKTTDESIDRE